MPYFDSDGVQIAYQVTGEGPPVLLIHGFASNIRVNWVATGWVKVLADAGHTVIAIDNRGHGDSEKLYDPAGYEAPAMAEDSRRLLDHLGMERADVMGYSMGARITAFLLLNHGDRVRRAVIAGMAGNMFKGVSTSDIIADALLADEGEDVTHPTARAFRQFAEQTRSDLKALSACMRAGRPALSRDALAFVHNPVLVVAGEDDEVAGPVGALADVFPSGRGLSLPGRDHMKAVGDLTFKRAVTEFFNGD